MAGGRPAGADGSSRDGYNNRVAPEIHRLVANLPLPAHRAGRRGCGARGASRSPSCWSLLVRLPTLDTYMPTMRSFGVYKLDVNQGNYLTQDMVDRLKVGQTEAAGAPVLGTPLVASAFRDNRWDYVYEFKAAGPGRSSIASSPSISSTTSSRAGKATRCRRRRSSSIARRAARTLPREISSAEDEGF